MVTLPVLVAVFVALSLGLGAGSTQQMLHHNASNHARVLSWGGDPGGLPVNPPGATSLVTRTGGLVCVTSRDVLDRGWFRLAPIELSSRACALDQNPD
jgi:hypothetical protein